MTVACPTCCARVLQRVEDVVVVPASNSAQASGIVAFARVLLGSLLIDSLVIRRRTDGSNYVSWPTRDDQRGRRHLVCFPIDDALRRHVEDAALAAFRAGDRS